MECFSWNSCVSKRLVVVILVLLNALIFNCTIVMKKSRKRSLLQNKSLDIRVLWTLSHVTSASRCQLYCQLDMACVSFFFNNVNLECQGHSIVHGLENGTFVVPSNSYYVLDEGVGYVGDACASSVDCVTVNAECRDNACWCEPGYSFWPEQRTCRVNCTMYGTDFTITRGYFIAQNNQETFVNVTIEFCVAQCLQATSFTCRTYEYGTRDKNCYLQNVTKLDVPIQWYPDINGLQIDHYQRDCQGLV